VLEFVFEIVPQRWGGVNIKEGRVERSAGVYKSVEASLKGRDGGRSIWTVPEGSSDMWACRIAGRWFVDGSASDARRL
jgi:hypothetical protein